MATKLKPHLTVLNRTSMSQYRHRLSTQSNRKIEICLQQRRHHTRVKRIPHSTSRTVMAEINETIPVLSMQLHSIIWPIQSFGSRCKMIITAKVSLMILAITMNITVTEEDNDSISSLRTGEIQYLYPTSGR